MSDSLAPIEAQLSKSQNIPLSQAVVLFSRNNFDSKSRGALVTIVRGPTKTGEITHLPFNQENGLSLFKENLRSMKVTGNYKVSLVRADKSKDEITGPIERKELDNRDYVGMEIVEGFSASRSLENFRNTAPIFLVKHENAYTTVDKEKRMKTFCPMKVSMLLLLLFTILYFFVKVMSKPESRGALIGGVRKTIARDTPHFLDLL